MDSEPRSNPKGGGGHQSFLRASSSGFLSGGYPCGACQNINALRVPKMQQVNENPIFS
jgi:hypothetical protein